MEQQCQHCYLIKKQCLTQSQQEEQARVLEIKDTYHQEWVGYSTIVELISNQQEYSFRT